ncbi:hypothetical protein ACUOCP_55965, partial [Escherichia sp. R-CC3]
TDNPAWIFYDLVVTERFGLGDRLTAANIDKWTLYQVAQYCDQMVPDGKGGSGTEPEALGHHQVVKNPRRIIRPCPLKRA